MRASIVVPTRDRPECLSRCLAALAEQRLEAGEYEIIVVDDGSSPPVALGPSAPAAKVRLVRRERAGGPAAARNAGIRIATGAVLAFTDDDCRPSPRWLEAGLAAVEAGAGVVMGRTRADERAAGHG